MINLNYNHLYYFYVVAKEGSIKRASQVLHVSQPTISHQIKLLEDYFNKQLFDRSHKSLTLTRDGIYLYEQAELFFKTAQKIDKTFSEESGGRTYISVGAVPFLPNNFIHQFLLRLFEDPQVFLKVVHGDLAVLSKKLLQGEIDLILSDSQQFSQSEKILSISLRQEKLLAVASKKFEFLKENFPYSLNQKPYLSFSGEGQIQKEINYFFELHQIAPDVIGQIDDVSLLRVVAEKGLCFTVLPEEAAVESLQSKSLVKLGELHEVKGNFWLLSTHQVSTLPALKNALKSYRRSLQ